MKNHKCYTLLESFGCLPFNGENKNKILYDLTRRHIVIYEILLLSNDKLLKIENGLWTSSDQDER